VFLHLQTTKGLLRKNTNPGS